MPRKFRPLYVKLDPAIDKRLKETVESEGTNKRAVVESALNIYFAVKSAEPVAETAKA